MMIFYNINTLENLLALLFTICKACTKFETPLILFKQNKS